MRLKDLPTRFEDALLARKDRRHRRAGLLHPLQFGRKRHPTFAVLFRLQPRFSRRRFPQLASQALGFGAGLGILQRDHRLSGTDDVAVRDQDLPDDAALKMLNCLAARSDSTVPAAIAALSSGAYVDQVPRPMTKPQTSRFPVQVTPRSRSRSAGGADLSPRGTCQISA